MGRRSDMDPNGHVNNVAYLAWAMEVVPEQVFQDYQLCEVSCCFHMLLQLDSSIRCMFDCGLSSMKLHVPGIGGPLQSTEA